MSEFQVALLTGLGVALVLEGVVYALFAPHMRRLVEMMAEVPDRQLRFGGLIAAIFGVLLVWLVRG